MPSLMLLSNPSEHWPQTAVGKNARLSTTIWVPFVEATLRSGMPCVVMLTAIVVARFHSSIACR